ncbi:MAG: hypothetical protein KGI08_01750 [Thaumarchaeota archaeon]|nr:hypothetical protein [Nitrososphaerota archaeon]
MLKLFIACIIAVTIFSTTAAFGQLSIGGPPQEDIKIAIDGNGTAHVLHEVQGNGTTPIHVEMISGSLANLTVTDQAGNSVQYSTISQSPMSVLLLPTQRNVTLIRYDIPNVVTNDNGVWRWNYYAPSDSYFTDFYFPKGVDMIWAQDRPVYLGEKGLRQVGNGMHLTYIINEPETVQTVQWQNQTFNVGIRTLANAGSYVFDQSAKTYAFNIDKANSNVVVIMPKALLWGPYQATINTNSTLASSFNDNGTYAWIGMKPAHNGTLQITGTTAIPEFPVFVPLAIAILSVVALRFANRLNFHSGY